MIGKIVALDLASQTGWAVVDEGGRVASGARDFTRGLPASGIERHAGIFDRFASWLPDLIQDWQPAVLVIEDVPRAKGNAARILCGLRALVLVNARRRELLVDPVSSSEWQCWARANGDWSRTDKSDENDALWLGVFWHTVRGGSVVVTARAA